MSKSILELKRESVIESLDFALSERNKIRKISKQLPILRVKNKDEINRLEKLLLDLNYLIEMEGEKNPGK